DVELRGLDPLPEIRPRRLLQSGGIPAVERPERDEVVLVLVSGEALHKGLIRDVVLAPGTLAAQAFDRQADQCVDDVVLRRPAAANTSLVPSVKPAACACFMNTGKSANSSEEKIRSGLAALSAATWLVRSMVPIFGHCSVMTLCSMLNRLSIATKAAMLLRP